MKGFEVKVLKGRGRQVAIGASILLHGVVLAYYVHERAHAPQPDLTAHIAPIPMELEKAPVVEKEKPVVKARANEQKAVKKAGGPPGVASKRVARPAVRGRAEQLDAIMAMDLNSLRANTVKLAVFQPKLQGTGQVDGPAPIEPDVHLSDATIEQIVAEGRGYVNEGKKKGRGRGAGGGMCP